MAVAFAAMKIFGQRLGVPMSMNGAIMFDVAVFLGNVLINYLQRAKYISPDLA